MKNLLFIVLFIPVLVATSCSKEDHFKKEQEEMDKETSGVELQAYKSFKVALRGTAVAGKDPAFDKARNSVLAAMAYTMSAASDTSHAVDPLQMMENSKTLLADVTLLAKKDEDSLPTILENISYVMNSGKNTNDPLSGFANESEEHIILAGLWMSHPAAPAGLTLYELSKVNDDDLRSVDVQIISKMVRTLLYYQHKWPYHSEKSADELIALVEKEKEYLIKNPWPMVDANGKTVTPEQAWHQLHGLAFVMRAMARMQMEDKEEDCNNDLSKFVKDAEDGGLDNEAVWASGVYVSLKKDDKEAALTYLGKLEKSKNLSKDELEAVSETKKYLEKKDKNEALSSFKDKIAIAKITGDYFGKILLNSKPVNNLKSTTGGKKFIAITDLNFTDIVTTSKNNLDSAVNKAKDWIKF